jgi:drug/metabolite transporter (DMT)-like permease
MTATALALVILAGLIHAIWNIAAKKAAGDVRFVAFAALMMMVIWAPLGLWLGWSAVPLWGATQWALVTASGVVHIFYYVILLRGYRKSDLTVVYPLARGTGPLLSSVVALFLLGEHLSLLGALGVAAMVGGVFLIAGGPGLFRAALDPAKKARVVTGMAYGLATGVFIATYTVLDGYAIKVVLMSPILVDYACNFVRVILLLPALLADRAAAAAHWRAQWKYVLTVAVLSPIAYVLVLFAMRVAPLSHVAPAREVSMLFAALIGGQLLGEGDRALRVFGAGCIAFGVIALALG